ncbi:MAG: hypothetical protein IH984_07540 [Planctomycetes bacterium]|nr:hypothetical protein [Planctomycetota bacterium]
MFSNSPKKDDWINLVGKFTTIDFTGFEDGTFITDQYAHQGVIFTDGNDNAYINEIFLNDGAGFDGNQAIDLIFDTPQTYITVDYPGAMQLELFSKGELIYTSSGFGVGGTGFFAGLVSVQPFDSAILTDWVLGEAVIDDLHFGFGIPGDVNHDGIVGIEDLLIILSGYGPCPEQVDPCPGDINDNNVVGISDLFLLLDNWGPCDDCDKPDGCFADTDDNCIVGTSDLLIILGSFGSCPDANYIICPEDITFDGTVDTSDILLVLNNWG